MQKEILQLPEEIIEQHIEYEILEIMDKFTHLEAFILENADNLKDIESAEQIVAQIKNGIKSLRKILSFVILPGKKNMPGRLMSISSP